MPKHLLHQSSMQASLPPLQPTRSSGIMNLLGTVFSRVSNFSSPGSNRVSGSTRGGRSSAGTGAGTAHPSNLINSEERYTTGTERSTHLLPSGSQVLAIIGRKSQRQSDASHHAHSSSAAGTPQHTSQQSGTQALSRVSRGRPLLGQTSVGSGGVQDLLPTGTTNFELSPPIGPLLQQQSRLLPAVSLGSSSVESALRQGNLQSQGTAREAQLVPTARTSSGTAQQPGSARGAG
jgi:hypothetical protein